MNRTRNVGVLVGSLRKASHSRKMALALQAIAPPSLRLSIIAIGAMSLYNQDDEPTPAWLAFRDDIRRADALLFVRPEYNRSIPAPLKNAVDVGSRPKGSSVFDGKPAAVITLTPGVLGGFGANHHLRQSLMCLNVPVMPFPEVYIGGADKLLDDSGALVVESTRQLLATFMHSFAEWIERNGRFDAA